jgi:hypothetical protein
MTNGEKSLDAWDLDDAYARSVRQMAGEKPWHAMPVHHVEAMLAEQSGQGLFGGVAGAFRFLWHALGINWSINAAAERRIKAEAVINEAARPMAMVATTILRRARSRCGLRGASEAKMKRGLAGRAFEARPVDRLMRDVRRLMLEGFPDLSGETRPPIAVPMPLVYPELSWRDGDAPGYSSDRARWRSPTAIPRPCRWRQSW